MLIPRRRGERHPIFRAVSQIDVSHTQRAARLTHFPHSQHEDDAHAQGVANGDAGSLAVKLFLSSYAFPFSRSGCWRWPHFTPS